MDIRIAEETDYAFARNLRKRLLDLNLKQNDLAIMTNISDSVISRYASGMSFPGYLNLYKIAKALQCDMDDLLKDIDILDDQDEGIVWTTINDHPTYEINSDYKIRNKKTRRILKNQKDDKNRTIIRIDGKTEKVSKLYNKAFDTNDENKD